MSKHFTNYPITSFGQKKLIDQGFTLVKLGDKSLETINQAGKTCFMFHDWNETLSVMQHMQGSPKYLITGKIGWLCDYQKRVKEF